MARADGDRDRGGAEPGHGIHEGASDARLAELLRADTVTAYPALQELRARHHPHVLAYARLCTPNESMARQLAAQAFTLAARRTARGIDSGLPWRHQLLLLVARSAGSWAGDGRAAGLDAGLLLVPDSPRDSADLQAHMTHCPHCTTAYEELAALWDAPRTALAEGLLPWGGTAYAAGDPGERAAGGTGVWRSGSGPAGSGRKPEDGDRAPDRRRTVLVSAVLGAALLPVAVFLAAQGGSPSPDPVGSANTQVSTPPVAVTVTATVSRTPPSVSASPSPSPSRTSNSPSPTRSLSPTKTASPKPPPSSTRPLSGSFAQVVNVASGLCLDVSGAFTNGTDVITASCSSSRTQRWRVDDDRGLLQSAADPDFCLDSRGATHRGVGIWECDSVEGRNGRNLMFAVDEDGLIRPVIAFGTAVTPDGGAGDGLSLESAGGGPGQRWRAGAA